MGGRFRYQTADFYDNGTGFLHRGDGEKLVRPVEVEAAGKNVGAGKSLEGELGTVCAAADGTYGGVIRRGAMASMAVSMMCMTGSTFSRIL